MSKLVTSSPHSASATSTPAAARCAATWPNSTNSSSYLMVPRPFNSTTARSTDPSGLSSSSRATSICARSWADGKGTSLIPGSPWIPSPMDICPGGTLNSGPGAPGRVQPLKATPSVRVRALALRASLSTSSRPSPASAADPATLKTVRSPAMPRRSAIRSTGALAMSSVTTTVRASVPSDRRRCSACPNCIRSPA